MSDEEREESKEEPTARRPASSEQDLVHKMFLLRFKLMHFVNSLHTYVMTRVSLQTMRFMEIYPICVHISGVEPGLSGGHDEREFSRRPEGMLPQKYSKIRVSKMTISSNLRQISYSSNTNFWLVNFVFVKKKKKLQRGAQAPSPPPPLGLATV